MRKITALLIFLCVVLCCVSALGEGHLADGNPVDFDDFTLDLESGAAYVVYDKTEDGVFLIVYPFFADGDENSNYNVSCLGGPDFLTIDGLQEVLDNAENRVREMFQEQGIILESFDYTDPEEITWINEKCYLYYIKMIYSMDGEQATTMQECLVFPGKGYVFTATAQVVSDDTAQFSKTRSAMENAIQWK